ncbi:hypothetical protein BZA77DRAFT_158857 [Pyronema omphalodes]|nr:hypothetical protein BZA77DRAFT_158857 [Pyronema omphalodes]
MPVTFKVASHNASQVKPKYRADTLDSYLQSCSWESARDLKEILQTSVTSDELTSLRSSKNGFVYACLEAYNEHHNLEIRPDDVWISIIGQFSHYVVAREEEMRSFFVDHEGKKKLTIRMLGNRYSIDFGSFAEQMAGLLDENIKDKSLRDWITPSFSTTEVSDTIVAAILMMCTLKNYFSFELCMACGIPEVTLHGTKEDWQDILTRLEKLKDFGAEQEHPHLHAWYECITPVLKHFISAFDGADLSAFFNRICHYESGGSGPTYLSGWISLFCAFNDEGQWQLCRLGEIVEDEHLGKMKWLTRVDTTDIPMGYGEVSVTVDDNGYEFHATMLAGSTGYKVLGENNDTLAPHNTWWVFSQKDKKEE